MNSKTKYIPLILFIIFLSLCNVNEIRLCPVIEFSLEYEFGKKLTESEDLGINYEKSADITQLLKAVKDLKIDGIIEDVAIEKIAFHCNIDYEGSLDELELSILLKIDDEIKELASDIVVPVESIRTGEEFNLSGKMNEEGAILLKESLKLLIEKITNDEGFEDFNRDIRVTIDNLPQDEEIYVKIIIDLILSVRYLETVDLF